MAAMDRDGVINDKGAKVTDESNDRAALSASNVESPTGNAPVATENLPRFTSHVHIRVISYRKRNHDPDGVSVKAVLDGIVRAGVLTDDSAKQVKSVTFESVKAEEEKTIIEIVDEEG